MNVVKAKMVWRCRRGIRELDSVLIPFTEDYYDQLPEIGKMKLQTLLSYQDDQLLAWILGRETPEDDGISSLVDSIIQYSKQSRLT